MEVVDGNIFTALWVTKSTGPVTVPRDGPNKVIVDVPDSNNALKRIIYIFSHADSVF